MNYYQRHIGDYARDTGHLSMLEDGAYQRLLDRYYATERPIPEADIYRVTRATTKAEKAAVCSVLAEFFKYDEAAKVYRHSRVERVIAESHETDEDKAARKENERERQRRHRERRKTLFDELRKCGEIPPFDTPNNELETLLSRVTQRVDNPNDGASVTAIHKPLANSHKPVTIERGAPAPEISLPVDWVPGPGFGLRLVRAGLPSDYDERALAAFIAYYRSGDTTLRESQWEEKFVAWLLREPKFAGRAKKTGADTIRDNTAEAIKIIGGGA